VGAYTRLMSRHVDRLGAATPAREWRIEGMDRQRMLTLGMALGLTLVAGAAWADGPSAGHGGEDIGTIRLLDRALSLVVLSDGAEFRAPDPAMLSNLKEGDLVRVDFMNDGGRSIINFIVPADADSIAGASPGSEPGPHEH